MRSTATMTICRTAKVKTFEDAAGVPEYESEDVEIEVTVEGVRQPAQRSVGIMSDYFEDVVAYDDRGLEFGGPRIEVELTEREMERAQEALAEDWQDGRTEAAENRWRAAREMRLGDQR